jgi:hypothetical protein
MLHGITGQGKEDFNGAGMGSHIVQSVPLSCLLNLMLQQDCRFLKAKLLHISRGTKPHRQELHTLNFSPIYFTVVLHLIHASASTRRLIQIFDDRKNFRK